MNKLQQPGASWNHSPRIIRIAPFDGSRLPTTCKIKGTILRWKEIHEWKETFTKSDVFFWVLVPSHKPLVTFHPVKFGVHRTCGIGYITFYICHVIKESRNTKTHFVIWCWYFYYKYKKIYIKKIIQFLS